MSRTNSLSRVCLPPANTKTIVFGCVRSILATSHLSFTSIPARPFSSWKAGSFFFLWPALIFPSERTNMWFTQKTNYLINVPTKADWWIALDLFLQWIDPKLNFHIWAFFTPTSQLLFHFFNHFACLWKLLQQCSVSRLIQGFWFHDSWPRVERVVVRREGANRGHVIGITSERGSAEMIAL